MTKKQLKVKRRYLQASDQINTKWENMKKYPVVNFKSPIMYFHFLLILALSALMILIIIKENNFWINQLSLIFFLMILVFLIYTMTGKVIIDHTIITRKSIFGTRSIRIEDIKSFAVFKQDGTFTRIIGESEFNSFDWIVPKTIFISVQKDYNPFSFKQKGTIKIHYLKELYIDIEQKLNACKKHSL